MKRARIAATANAAGLLRRCRGSTRGGAGHFRAHCYGVGAAALHGESGVLEVARGWHAWHEVERGVYDPAAVSLGELEQRLQAADTHVRTPEEPGQANTTEEIKR